MAKERLKNIQALTRKAKHDGVYRAKVLSELSPHQFAQEPRQKKEHKGLRQAQKLGDESNEKDAQWREKTNPFHKKCLLKNVPSYSNNWGLNRANDMTSGPENLRHGELNRRLFIIR